MEEKRKAPELRFPGFTDDWEQRKLGEVGRARSGTGFPNAEQGGKEGIPFYKVSDMNIPGNEHEMTTANNYVTAEQINRKGWKPIEEVPAMFFAKVGAAVLLNRKRLCRVPFLLDNNTMAYTLDSNMLDTDFTKALFDTIDLSSLVQVGALPSYNASDVERIEVQIPNVREQKKIGAFFSTLDKAIALHQRKENLLRELKKGMLQKIFSQEIRFKDDNGQNFPDWENKKLGELVTFQNGFNGGKECFGTGMPLISVNEVLSDSPVFHDNIKGKANIDDETQSRFLVEYGDILFQRSSETREEAGSSNVYLDKSHPAIFGGFVIRGKKKENYCPEFIRYALKAEFVRHEIFKLAQGAQHINIGQDMLSTLKVDFPSIPEQKKIANVLSDIEKRITAEQKKVSSLQTMKKGFLQKMFV